LLTAQLFCRSKPGSATAYNYDTLGMAGSAAVMPRWFGLCSLFPSEDPRFRLFDQPTRYRAKGRCAHSFTRVEVETSMMPRAPDRAFCNQSLSERPMIMGAKRSQNGSSSVLPNQYRWLISHAAFGETSGKIRNVYALGEIGTFRHIRLIDHGPLLWLLCR
jgi:hypothetical protein